MDIQTQLEDTPPPWLQILIQPRQVINRLLETDPARHVRLLTILGGGAILVVWRDGYFWQIALLGGLTNLLVLPFFAAILQIVGHVLGVQSSRMAIRAALAWSMVPLILFAAIRWLMITTDFMEADGFGSLLLRYALLFALLRTMLISLSEAMGIPLPGTLLVIAISAFLFVVAVRQLVPVVENVYSTLATFDPYQLSGLLAKWLIERNAAY